MAEHNITMKQKNDQGEYDVLYPKTTPEQAGALSVQGGTVNGDVTISGNVSSGGNVSGVNVTASGQVTVNDLEIANNTIRIDDSHKIELTTNGVAITGGGPSFSVTPNGVYTTGNISMGNLGKVTDLAEPTEDDDAATKGYVDSMAGGWTYTNDPFKMDVGGAYLIVPRNNNSTSMTFSPISITALNESRTLYCNGTRGSTSITQPIGNTDTQNYFTPSTEGGIYGVYYQKLN